MLCHCSAPRAGIPRWISLKSATGPKVEVDRAEAEEDIIPPLEDISEGCSFVCASAGPISSGWAILFSTEHYLHHV